MIGTVRGMMLSHKEVAGLPASIASFRSNASGVKLDSLKVLVEAQQDLHGYDKPWAGGGGKNELAMSVSNIKSLNTTGTWNGNVYTLNGVSFTIITDNAENVTGIKVNGTATAEANFDIAVYSLKDGTSKKINGTSTQPSDTTVAYGFRGYGNVSANADRTMTRAEGAGDWNNYVYIKVYQGYNAQNLMYYPMIRDASISDGTFAPYSNICPITGWSGVNVTRCGKNLFNGTLENGSFNTTTGEKYSTTTRVCSVNDIPLPSGSYVLNNLNGYQFVLYVYDLEGNFKRSESYIYWENNPLSFSLVADRKINFAIRNDTNTNIAPSDVVGLALSLTATAYEPYNGNTYTIQFGNEYYGGELDVTNGVLRVTQGFKDLGDLNWTSAGSGDGQIFTSTIPDSKEYSASTTANAICSQYKVVDWSYMTNNPSVEMIFAMAYSQKYLAVKDHSYSDATQFKTAMAGVQLVYELATPFTIQLTPQQIEQLEENNIWADSGDVSVCKYSDRVVTVLFSKG